MQNSEYIIYVDESGDHSLTSIDPNYPIFVVAFSIFEKATYAKTVGDLLKLKFDTFGHDMVVLHERDIRKRRGEFAFIRDPVRGPKFLNDLTTFVNDAAFTLVAAVIKKAALVAQYAYPDNPYGIALTFCLERAYGFMKDAGQESRLTYVVVESRGRKTRIWNCHFRRTCAGHNMWGSALPFEIRFSDKKCNSTGMQLADLVARPIGQEILVFGIAVENLSDNSI
jgi:hypothetical protein